MSEDEEYELLLSSQAKKTRQEPAKEAALQRTINLKLRQATQELLNKRNALAEKLCRLDDNFVEKEKSYKMQMHTFTQQIKKEQACRVRAEGQVESAKSQVETYKSLAETQTANLQAIALERDDILVRLQQLQEEADEQLDLQAAGFQTQISEMKAEMQAQIDIKDRELQEKDALAASESEAMVASESDTRRQVQKYMLCWCKSTNTDAVRRSCWSSKSSIGRTLSCCACRWMRWEKPVRCTRQRGRETRLKHKHTHAHTHT